MLVAIGFGAVVLTHCPADSNRWTGSVLLVQFRPQTSICDAMGLLGGYRYGAIIVQLLFVMLLEIIQ